VGGHDSLMRAPEVSVDVEEVLDDPNMETMQGSTECISDSPDLNSPNPA